MSDTYISYTYINGIRYRIGSSAYYYALLREQEYRRREEERRRREEAERRRREEEERHRRDEERRQQEEAERRRREAEERRQLEEAERRRREEEKRRQREEEERRRREEKERQKRIAEAWNQAQESLRSDIKKVQNSPEREQLSALVKKLEASFKQAMSSGDISSAEKIVGNLRQEIISVQSDERMLASQRGELSKFLSKLSMEAPKGFAKELEAIRRGDGKSDQSSIEEQTRSVKSLMGKAYRLAKEITQANAISLDGIVEETAFIPPVIDENAVESETALKASLVCDICDFWGRVAFFSEDEAERLKPLVLEAKQGASAQRLKLIRSQVKTTYGRLREQAILTDIFKRDFRDFLPLIRKAHDTERLCTRMEDLLTAPIISREDYNDIYKEVTSVFIEQMETIDNAMLTEKIGQTLEEMGYALMDEQGNPVELEAGEMRLLSTPYEGYRVRFKVNRNNTVATRLVRVVGSEEEKTSVSEYQRQKDIETGKKWCHDLDKFYSKLEEEGLTMSTVMRKEPGEEPLDIIVDKSAQTQRRQAAARRRQEELKERGREAHAGL